jgi:glycosyltransferase involved in cell wall biosynthesis
MHVLFIHDAFPAQFGRLALELTRRFGWKCSFLVKSLSRCPTPSREMLETLSIARLPAAADAQTLPWPQIYGGFVESCRAVAEAVRSRKELHHPDLVVANGGRGPPTLFLPEVLNCPIVNYCEYYFAARGQDISYRIDLPPAEPASFFPRCINAPTLASLVDCTAGYAPTQWQKESFPKRFWPKIEVHRDGIDTEMYRPRKVPRVIGGRSIPPETRIVTYVARGLESMRGFDQFMELAQRILRFRQDVLFVVVGSEGIYYGWDKLHTGSESFMKWVLARDEYDLSRFMFLSHIEPEALAHVLCLSDLHVYLSVPFVLSWSFLDALASGCVVLASDVPPVREVITPGKHALVAPFFDLEILTENALLVLKDPTVYRPLGQAARLLIEERHDMERCVSELKEFFERVAAMRPETAKLPAFKTEGP